MPRACATAPAGVHDALIGLLRGEGIEVLPWASTGGATCSNRISAGHAPLCLTLRLVPIWTGQADRARSSNWARDPPRRTRLSWRAGLLRYQEARIDPRPSSYVYLHNVVVDCSWQHTQRFSEPVQYGWSTSSTDYADVVLRLRAGTPREREYVEYSQAPNNAGMNDTWH